MPIYEYQCQACDARLEKLQKMSDPPLKDCPSCGKPALRKLVSAAGFRLKGGGWYETDFKKTNKRNLAGDGASAGSEGKSEGKSSDTGKDTGKSSASSDSAGKSSKPAASGGQAAA